jgi:hypothetical protein
VHPQGRRLHGHRRHEGLLRVALLPPRNPRALRRAARALTISSHDPTARRGPAPAGPSKELLPAARPQARARRRAARGDRGGGLLEAETPAGRRDARRARRRHRRGVRDRHRRGRGPRPDQGEDLGQPRGDPGEGGRSREEGRSARARRQPAAHLRAQARQGRSRRGLRAGRQGGPPAGGAESPGEGDRRGPLDGPAGRGAPLEAGRERRGGAGRHRSIEGARRAARGDPLRERGAAARAPDRSLREHGTPGRAGADAGEPARRRRGARPDGWRGAHAPGGAGRGRHREPDPLQDRRHRAPRPGGERGRGRHRARARARGRRVRVESGSEPLRLPEAGVRGRGVRDLAGREPRAKSLPREGAARRASAGPAERHERRGEHPRRPEGGRPPRPASPRPRAASGSSTAAARRSRP